MTNLQPSDDNMKDRINNLFSGQELPPYASIREVEAMKARIREMEQKLAQQAEPQPAESEAKQNAASENKVKFPTPSQQEASAANKQQQARNALQTLALFLGALVVSLPIYLYWAVQTGAWQIYAALAGLVVAGILVGFGISLARRNLIERAMVLLIATAHFIIPFIVALISGVGLVLAVTQFLVILAIVGQTFSGTRAIRLIVAGFVFSMATLLIDLAAPWERLRVPELQTAIPVIAVILIGLLGLVVARQFNTYSLRTKLGATFVTIALVSIGAVGFVTNRIVTSQYNETLGANFSELAFRMARETGDSIIRSKIAMDGLALNKFIQDGVEEANLTATSDISVLTDLDKQWTASAGDSPLIKQVLDNELSGELRELQERLPQYAELFVTDKYGAIIASTNRTSDYYQADEEWWQSAWNNKAGSVYISQPTFDASAWIYAVDIAIPIPAHNRLEVIGVLRATVNINEITNVLSASQIGQTGQAVLALPNNQFLSQEISVDIGILSPGNIETISSLDTLQYGQFEYDGVQSLVSKAPVTSSANPDQEAIENLNWTIVVHQDLVEAHEPITTTTRGILITAIAVLIATGLLSLFVGGQFAGPIETLTALAEQITKGDLSAKAPETSQDEIGTLASTFNRMTSQLRDTLIGLEQRVTDRTHDLELAAEVGQTVAARVDDLNVLLNEAVELIRSRFNLYYTQVYLADRSGRTITLRAGTGEVGKQLVQRGHNLLIASNSLNGRAAAEQRAMIVADTSESESFLPNPLLPNTRSEMAVPLLIGERVVGVLDMQSEQPNALNETNLPAFETLAGQLAVAVQNAFLFEQASQAREEVEHQAQRQSYADWASFLNAVERNEKIGYIYNQNEVIPYVNISEDLGKFNSLHAPINVAGVEIGKIHIVDNPERKWTTTEADIIHNTATQLSRHIETLRLLAQSEKYRLEAEQASRRLTREGWEDFLLARENLAEGFMYDQYKVVSITDMADSNGAFHVRQPLLIRNEIVGELETTLSTAMTSQESQTLIQQVADSLSAHIENLRLAEQTQATLLSTENLYNATRTLTAAQTEQEALNELVQRLDRTGLDRIVAALKISNEPMTAEVVSAWDRDGLEARSIGNRFTENQLPLVAEIRPGTPVIIEDFEASHVHPLTQKVFKMQGVRSAAIVPISSNDEILGWLLLETTHATRQFQQAFIQQYLAFSEQVATVIQKQRLFERAEAQRLEIQQNETRLSEALKIARLANWEYDVEKDIFTFNDQFYSIFHTTAEKVGGYRLSSAQYADLFVHPDDMPIVGAEIGKALSSTERYYAASLEHRIKFADAGTGYIAVNLTVERDEEGKITRYYGANQDITERKLAEEALRKAQEQYELAIQGANDGIWDWDIANDSIYYSPRWKGMLGYEAHELTRGFVEWEELIHPEDRDRAVKALDDYLEQRAPEYDVELRLRHKDGAWRWIRDRGKALRREDGTPYRMAGSHSDITERKQAENLIAQRANQLETVATVSTTTATVLNPDALLQTVVDLTKERFGLYHAHIYLADEAWNTLLLAAGAGDVGRNMVAAGHAIQTDKLQSLVARAYRERNAVIVNDIREDEGFLPNPLLPETRAEMAVPMIVGDKVIGVFDMQSEQEGTFTEEDALIYNTLAAQVAIALQNARLYQEQAATVTQLRELDRLKSSFLANMSHELRTPLNSILGFADVMLEGLDGPLTDYMNNDLRLIQKNGQHLLHLINDVLDMAKIESGRMNLHPETFAVHDILEEVASITSSLANDKNLALYIEPASDREVQINADRTRLRQVMINLVNNALKFTEKGNVSIHVTKTDEEHILIAVHDSGLGIPPEQLDDIFDEFTQVDTSTTRKAGGTGLGLPISRRLVEMHGGELWAESTGLEGEGSTFYVKLPIEAQIAEVEKQEKK